MNSLNRETINSIKISKMKKEIKKIKFNEKDLLNKAEELQAIKGGNTTAKDDGYENWGDGKKGEDGYENWGGEK